MKNGIFVILMLFAASFCKSQTAQTSIGSATANEFFYELKYDASDGGTVSVGYANNAGTANDCFITKSNALHQIVWQKVIANPGDDYFNQVIVCSNGDYVAVGKLTQSGVGRGIVCRFNSTTGAIIWSSSSILTGSANGDLLYDVIETVNNNIAVVGTTDFSPGTTNGFAVLLTGAGAPVWSRVTTFVGSDEFQSIRQLPNNNLLIAGFHNTGGAYSAEILELNETTAAILFENVYTINTTVNGNAVNSIWPYKCQIKNGAVLYTLGVFQGFGGQSQLGIYNYNLATRNLSGNIYYHSGVSNATSYSFGPIDVNDFVITQTYSSPTNNMFVSRVTNGSVVFDRKVTSVASLINSTNVSNSSLAFCGAANSSPNFDAFNMFSSTSFPASATPCNIADQNTLLLQASTLTATASATITLVSGAAMSSNTAAVTNTTFSLNNICGCTAATINAQPTDATLCGTGNTSFSIGATNATGYQWQLNTGSAWIDITNGPPYSGATTNTLTITGATTAMNNYLYRAVITSPCSSVTSSQATLFVQTPAAPSISISASPGNSICAGTNVTFTAASINGGSSPFYQWQKNGINVGTNSTTYSSNTLINGDIIKCILTSNASCVTTPTATSNSVTMTVNPLVIPSITISPSANNICVGTSVMFTATITNGGTTPIFQWQKNNVNVGTNSSTYNNSSLNNGDVIKCILTSNANCLSTPTATSNSVVMIINSSVPNVRYPTVVAITNSPTQLLARTVTNASYLWVPPVGLNNSAVINPVFTYNAQQEYKIHITVTGNCEIVDTLLVTIAFQNKGIYVPKAFSPNGDGNNDRLYPILVGITHLNFFRIYNRWSNLMFESADGNPATGWDGSYKGKLQPVETYYWTAEGVAYDGEIIKVSGNTLLLK